VPALCGVSLVLDAESTRALGPWLDANPALPDGPCVGVNVAIADGQALPEVLDLLVEEPGVWLGRTSTGLVLGGRGQSWFVVEGAPAVIRGFVGADRADEAERYVFICALLVALRTIGVYSLHAAALCSGDRALVLVGDSGAGKSTTALALACAGCGYLGDDAILIRKRSNDVELVAYWPSFRLTEEVLSSFTTLRPHIFKRTTDPKWRLDTSAAFPGRYLQRWLGPTTLLFLTRSALRTSSLSRLTSAEATGLLIAQSSALGLECHPNPRRHLDILALMANRAQLARLELGHEWLDDPSSAALWLLESVQHLSERNELP
jgi:hypothetical protein